MKLKDMRISTQLRLGLGVVLALVVFMAALVWIQTDILRQQVDGLYRHPLQVRRALGELTADVLAMHRGMKDLFLTEDEGEISATLQQIEERRVNADRQFGLLYDWYLGPREDVVHVEDSFAKWNAMRGETIRMLRAGRRDEAVARTKLNGVAGVQVEKILAELKDVSDFSHKRGEKYFQDATDQNRTLNRRLALATALILLMTVAVMLLILRGIRTPLKDLLAATEAFRQGRMDVRSGYFSANEFGELAASFNTMADTVQTEVEINEKAAQLAGVMVKEEDARSFCHELLKILLPHSGAQVGAVYLLNETRTAYALFESIGLDGGGRAAFSAVAPEGEFGAALATRSIQRVRDIPPDSRFIFAASGGSFVPRDILTIPVLSKGEVTAVLSLAGVREFSASAVRLVGDIWPMLSARMNGVLLLRQVQTFAEKLEAQNRELETQKSELAMQADELAEQNTELEMQKRELDEANRLKSAFLSNMSHELRTPLNSVIALSGVLGRRLARSIPEEEYSFLEVIERNGRHLLSLINDILDLSRIEAGREEINPFRVSLREFAGEITGMIAHQAMEKGVELVNGVDDGLPPLLTDADKLRHILQNLIGNAVKFTERGKVTVSARREGEDVHITVTDTGIGIAADQLPHIFDEFRQADGSASRKYGGTGLGLAIAKKYALLLRGGITVESEPGRGSVFTLRLPLALDLSRPHDIEEDRRRAVESHPAHGPAPDGRGRCILLVEDSGPAIVQVTDILTARGFRVMTARDGAEALDLVRETLPDGIILDLMMPGMDGFQVLNTLRGGERTAHLPVLILTAKHVSREEMRALKSNNIHQLIQKGDISAAGLLAAVDRMLAPLQADAAPAPETPRRVRRHVRPGKPLVLVVEDNPDSLRTARAVLEGHFRVIEAQNGLEGLAQARKHLPDLVLMDIAMPVMDGLTALGEIRKEESLRDVPVVAVTASAMTGDRETILAHGFDGYISKPIDGDLLRETLREFLAEDGGGNGDGDRE